MFEILEQLRYLSAAGCKELNPVTQFYKFIAPKYFFPFVSKYINDYISYGT